MKKGLSILFLWLMALNAIGYYGLLLLAQTQLAFEVQRKIDQHAATISGNLILKIPYTLPYASSSHEYERANGEITYGGVVYRVVKRRIYDNSLYIVCIKDTQSTEVNQVISDYSKTFTDQASESASSSGKATGQLAKEYIITILHSKIASAGWCLSSIYGCIDKLYHHAQLGAVFHPPRLASQL